MDIKFTQSHKGQNITHDDQYSPCEIVRGDSVGQTDGPLKTSTTFIYENLKSFTNQITKFSAIFGHFRSKLIDWPFQFTGDISFSSRKYEFHIFCAEFLSSIEQIKVTEKKDPLNRIECCSFNKKNEYIGHYQYRWYRNGHNRGEWAWKKNFFIGTNWTERVTIAFSCHHFFPHSFTVSHINAL